LFRKLFTLGVIMAVFSLPAVTLPSHAAGFGLPDAPKLPAAAGVGETVAVTPIASPPAGKISYRWLIDKKAVPKATSLSLKVPAGTLGKSLQVQELATVGKQSKVVGVSLPLVIGQQSVPSVPTVVFGDTASSSLSVVLPSDNFPATATATYQWFHGGIEIANAKAATYKYTAEERGLLISVGVTYKRPVTKTRLSIPQTFRFQPCHRPTNFYGRMSSTLRPSTQQSGHLRMVTVPSTETEAGATTNDSGTCWKTLSLTQVVL